MDIGIFVFVTDQTVNPAILARKAEDLGFESFWGYPNTPYYPCIPAPHIKETQAEGSQIVTAE